MKTITSALLIIALLLSFSVLAPAQTLQWSKTFGGPSGEIGEYVQQTVDGGYIIVGTAWPDGAEGSNIWLIKTDAGGNQQWSKTFGDTNEINNGVFVQQTSDGGYFVVGMKLNIPNFFGIWLVKTDANGNEQWDKLLFLSSTYTWVTNAEQTADGGYIMAGLGTDIPPIFDVGTPFLTKIDANGNVEWEREYAVGYSNYVRQTTDGGYILVTQDIDTNSFCFSTLLIRIDASGNELWRSSFGETCSWPFLEFYSFSVDEADDGGYLIAGSKYYSSQSSQIWLLKTDADGNKLWDKTYGTGCADSVERTIDGGFIVAREGVTLLKVDANGNQQWVETYGADTDYANCVHQTTDGGYIIVGGTGGDVWLLKVEGIPSWALPVISLYPGSLSNTCAFGDNAPDQNFEVWNSGFQTLSYEITSDAPWLSCSPVNGTSTGEHDTIAVHYQTAGLAPGTYTATITVSGRVCSNTPQQIPVSLVVEWPELTPMISVAPTSLTNSCVVGSNAPNQRFDIWNSANLTLSYSISENTPWLSCTPTSGTSTGEHDRITVQYATSSLAIGTYMGTITISAPMCPNSPQELIVTLTVKGPKLTRITPVSPMNGSTLISPPNFAWLVDGGVNDAFVVDLSLSSPTGPFKTGPIVTTTNWTLPRSAWKRIPAGGHVYWRVRGADQSKKPRTIVTSPTWSFYKQ